MMPWLRKIVRIQWGEGHPTWNAVWITLGPLWFIWCASDRSNPPAQGDQRYKHPDIPGHPSVWMLAWRRRTPEWDPAKGKWKTIPALYTDEPAAPEWDAKNPHDVAAQLPPLEKIVRDLEYRLPGSGKPLANIVLTREQAADVVELLATSK
jgi:hypothetical protein